MARTTFVSPLKINCFIIFLHIIPSLIIPLSPEPSYFHGNSLTVVSYIGIAFNLFCTLADKLFDVSEHCCTP